MASSNVRKIDVGGQVGPARPPVMRPRSALRPQDNAGTGLSGLAVGWPEHTTRCHRSRGRGSSGASDASGPADRQKQNFAAVGNKLRALTACEDLLFGELRSPAWRKPVRPSMGNRSGESLGACKLSPAHALSS
jgi:hypothetical protein